MGALLAAAAVSDVNPSTVITTAILGGSMTASTHAAKAGTRMLINTSPEPFTNWFASLGEDIAVIGGIWTALHYPLLFVIFLIFFMILLFFFLPKIWKGLVKIFTIIANLVRPKQQISQNNVQPDN